MLDTRVVTKYFKEIKNCLKKIPACKSGNYLIFFIVSYIYSAQHVSNKSGCTGHYDLMTSMNSKEKKNPSYRRRQLSRPMRIVAPITSNPIHNNCPFLRLHVGGDHIQEWAVQY